MAKWITFFIFVSSLSFHQIAFSNEFHSSDDIFVSQDTDHEESYDELNSLWQIDMFACTQATSSNLATVNSGNAKLTKFLTQCAASTNNSSWCQQLVRPNPASVQTFKCTYGESQPHRLIHPDESTWANAFKAAQFVTQLEGMGIKVAQIYNWWRPEPYNANVGGAAGRHPLGTSIDVRFCTNADAIRGFDELCKVRKTGAIRALGYYGSTGVHIGVGDTTANTWGRTCK